MCFNFFSETALPDDTREKITFSQESVASVEKENVGPKRKAKKRSAEPNESAAKRKIHFSEDLEAVEDDHESPHVDLAKTSCSTPSNVKSAVAERQYSMDDVMDFVNSKLNEVMDAQESHMKKVMKENSAFRRKLLDIMRNGEKPESLSSVKQAIKAHRVEHEPLMFNGIDLMQFKPTDEGPSVFGRTIAPEIFGKEDSCKLIKERMGWKVNRRNSRVACDKKLEEIFQLCVERNYSNNAEEAISRAISGANQYGIEMKAKHAL